MLPLNVAPTVQTASKRFTNETTWMYWIMVNVVAPGRMGLLTVYDGWDANGVERMRISVGYSRTHVFIPPIRCQDGLYVEKGPNIDSYVVGWRTEASLPQEKE